MATLYVGQLFGSYCEFINVLKAFEKENFVCFSKRESRKIESIRHKVKRPLVTELIIYEAKFTCIRGGPLRLKGSGKRKTSTFKIDCPAHISLRATPDGKSLEIKSLNTSHNHEISEVLFKHLPQQRKLPPEVREYAKELLHLNVNKKLLQQKLQRETGKVITLKDLSNLTKQHNRSNNLCEAVTLLQEKYDFDDQHGESSNHGGIELKRNDKSHEESESRPLMTVSKDNATPGPTSTHSVSMLQQSPKSQKTKQMKLRESDILDRSTIQFGEPGTEGNKQISAMVKFFESLLPDIQALTISRQRKFKEKTLSTLYSLLEEQEKVTTASSAMLNIYNSDNVSSDHIIYVPYVDS